jgi:iron complex outermembrane receptor protein
MQVKKVKFNAFYYMGYKDQLILTGELDDVGAPLEK